MRALVTGASGFVGGALTDALIDRGHDVWTLVHDADVSSRRRTPRQNVVRGSLVDPGDCERAVIKSNPNVVFHLGAQAIVPHARRDPHGTFEVNVRGTYNMLEAFTRMRTSDGWGIVVASSDKAYGEIVDNPLDASAESRYRETDPLQGRGPYDVSKSCADLIAQSYALEFGIPVGIVRAGNIYGPGDIDMTRIVPCVASSLARGQAPVLTSDGSPIRDYLYIDDVVSAYIAVADHITMHDLPGARRKTEARAFNFSGGEPVSAYRLAELAIEIEGLGFMKPIVKGTRVGEIGRQALDSSKARGLLSWSPTVDLRTGLERTIRWWKRQVGREG